VQTLLFLLWGAGGVLALCAASIAAANLHPAGQLPTDSSGWPPWVERLGVPIALLVVIGVALWRLIGWARPKADLLIDSTLARSNSLERILSAQADRDTLLLEAIRELTVQITRLSDRSGAHFEEEERVGRDVVQIAGKIDDTTAELVALGRRVERIAGHIEELNDRKSRG
jgi:hypothetical protein